MSFPYSLVERLAAGAQGEVWRAEHRPSGTLVAIKRLPEHLVDNRVAFLAEARRLAAFDHPYVVHLLDAGVADAGPFAGLPFLVLELATHTLADGGLAARAGDPDASALLEQALAEAPNDVRADLERVTKQVRTWFDLR